jgi:hypothetical protein
MFGVFSGMNSPAAPTERFFRLPSFTIFPNRANESQLGAQFLGRPQSLILLGTQAASRVPLETRDVRVYTGSVSPVVASSEFKAS